MFARRLFACARWFQGGSKACTPLNLQARKPALADTHIRSGDCRRRAEDLLRSSREPKNQAHRNQSMPAHELARGRSGCNSRHSPAQARTPQGHRVPPRILAEPPLGTPSENPTPGGFREKALRRGVLSVGTFAGLQWCAALLSQLDTACPWDVQERSALCLCSLCHS